MAELVFFDPYAEYLEPRLQGYRLERGSYRPVRLDRDGALELRTAGVRVRPEGERLRLMDAVSGEKLLWDDELEEALLAAEARAAGEATARRLAEERAAEEATARRWAEERARALAEELDRLRRESKI